MSAPYRVSVIIPCHNAAAFAGRAIASAMAQTYPPDEVVVVDDGSVDERELAAASHAAAVRLIRHDVPRGVSAARNSGAAVAVGDWLAFLDADDYWHPEKLEAQIRALQCWPEAVLVFTDFRHVDQDGRVGPWAGGIGLELVARSLRLDVRDGQCGSIEGPVTDVLLRHRSFMHTSAVMVSSEAFRTVGGFDERMRSAEDLDLWFRCAEYGPIVVVDSVYVDAFQRTGSLGRDRRLAAEGMLRFFEKTRGVWDVIGSPVRRDVQLQRAEELVSLSWELRRAGENGEALRTSLAAFRTVPSRAALLAGLGALKTLAWRSMATWFH